MGGCCSSDKVKSPPKTISKKDQMFMQMSIFKAPSTIITQE